VFSQHIVFMFHGGNRQALDAYPSPDNNQCHGGRKQMDEFHLRQASMWSQPCQWMIDMREFAVGNVLANASRIT